MAREYIQRRVSWMNNTNRRARVVRVESPHSQPLSPCQRGEGRLFHSPLASVVIQSLFTTVWQEKVDYRLLAYDTASPYVWEYRGAPKRFSFRVAYRGTRERDEGTLSPEETVSVGG
jgi:hypothetical protein